MLQFPGRAVKLSTCSSMFCLYHILWLLICSLLLMADSLSAVPHQMHNPVLSTTIGEWMEQFKKFSYHSRVMFNNFNQELVILQITAVPQLIIALLIYKLVNVAFCRLSSVLCLLK